MLKQQCSIVCSLAQMETEEEMPNLNLQRRPRAPRFQRVKSSERSKSKQLSSSRRQSPSFFVKNVFVQQSNSTQRLDSKQNQQGQNKEEEVGPLKIIRRRNNQIVNPRQSNSNQIDSVQTLQKRCQQLNILLDRSNSYIMQLQSKIETLQSQTNKHLISTEDSSPYINKMETKTSNKEKKANDLIRLRRQIAQTRKTQIIPAQVYADQIKILQAQNLCLKEQVNKLKLTIKDYEEVSIKILSQKEIQLEKLISKLRKNINESQKRQDQLRLQISMLRLRQSKQAQNKIQIQNQQLMYLRYRYQKLRKKYEQVRKHLQVNTVRSNYLISECKQYMEITLQLSP